MEALGHSSKAVHRSYAKKAQVKIPALEDFEQRIIALPEQDHSRNAQTIKAVA